MPSSRDDADITIRIVADRRRGIWAHMFAHRGVRAIQQAGRISSTASRHTLLAVALLSTLRGITRKRLERLQITNRKARILVQTLDADFGPAVVELLKQPKTKTKIGRNFRDELIWVCRRFDLAFENGEDEGALLSLLNWSRNGVFGERYLETTPRPFQAIAASQFAPVSQI